jgi:hypothetical protein
MPVRVRLSEGLGVCECRIELDDSGSATHVPWLKLHEHEGLWRCIVFRGDAEGSRRPKPEARVVGWVPEHYNSSDAERSAALEASADQSSADAFALMRWRDSHWRQTHKVELIVTRKRDGAEHDVADDLAAILGDQGGNG